VAAALDQVLARRCPFLQEPPPAAATPPPSSPPPAPQQGEDASDFRMFSWVPPATPCALTTPAAAALATSQTGTGSSRPAGRQRPAGSALLGGTRAPKPTQQQLAALAEGADATVAHLAHMQQQQQQQGVAGGPPSGVSGVVLEGRPAVDPTTRAALLTGTLPGSASVYTAATAVGGGG
jgi:hypothetical protein